MIGGCERESRSPVSEATIRAHTSRIRSLIGLRHSNSRAAFDALGGAGAIDGGTGAGLASGFDSWHLFFCQASSASFDWPRNAM